MPKECWTTNIAIIHHNLLNKGDKKLILVSNHMLSGPRKSIIPSDPS